MGKFAEIITKLSDQEMSEVWQNITNYGGEYIDDFLTELNVRGNRDDYISDLKGLTLVDILIKVENITSPQNIEFLKAKVEDRGLKNSYEFLKNEKKVKKKVNYTLPTAGIALLIVAFVKFFARNADQVIPSNEDQKTMQNMDVNSYTSNEDYQNSSVIDSSRLKAYGQNNFESLKPKLIEIMFDSTSVLSKRLQQWRRILPQLKTEGTPIRREYVIEESKKDVKIMLTSMKKELIAYYTPDQVIELNQAITERYLQEINKILDSYQ